MILGGAALLSLSIIGRLIAVMAMLSVIGIPFVFLLAAIPTLFLLSLFTLAIAAALNLPGGKRIALAIPLALGAMLLFPLAHNAIGTAYIASLVKEDQTPAIGPWDGETMALVVPTDQDVTALQALQVHTRTLASAPGQDNGFSSGWAAAEIAAQQSLHAWVSRAR